MVQDGDLATNAAPIDFLGVNGYHDDNVSGHPRCLPTPKPVSRRPSGPPLAFRRQRVRDLSDAAPAADGRGLEVNPGCDRRRC